MCKQVRVFYGVECIPPFVRHRESPNTILMSHWLSHRMSHLGGSYNDRLCSTKIDSIVPESTPCSTHMADWCPEPDDHNPELTNVSTHLTGCNTQTQHNLPQSTRPASKLTELNHINLQVVADPGGAAKKRPPPGDHQRNNQACHAGEFQRDNLRMRQRRRLP